MDTQKATLHQIAARGGHLIRLHGDKTPSGYTKCRCDQLANTREPGLKGHGKDCNSWLANPMSADDIDRWDGLVGLIPATVGLMAIDIDSGIKDTAPSKEELIAARVAWQSLLGIAPRGFQGTQSGGRHDLYGMQKAGAIGNRSWVMAGRDDLERLCGGDVRAGRGYIVLWGPAQVLKAMDTPGGSAVWQKTTDKDLARFAGAAGLAFIPNGQMHDYIVKMIASDCKSGAMPNPDPWILAAKLTGFAADGGIEEVRKAWDTAKSKYGQGAEADWTPNITSICPLPHGDNIRAIEVAADMLRHRLRWLDDRFMIASKEEPIWIPSDLRAQRGVAQSIGVCRECMQSIFDGVLLKISERDRRLETARDATFWLDGEIVRIGKGRGRDRIRKAYHDDLLRWEPRSDLSGGPGEDEPMIVSGGMRTLWQLDDGEIAWMQSWMSRSLDGPQRRGPFIVGRSSIGKSVLQSAVLKGMPYGSVEIMSGKDVDRYAGEDLMKAIFVFMDDAQLIPDDGWAMAQARSGGAASRVRAMKKSDPSRRSESSLGVIAEGPYMGFDERFKRRHGWDNRLAYLFAQGDQDAWGASWMDMILSDEQVRILMWWIINGDNDTSDFLMDVDTERMLEWRGMVHTAAEKEVKGGVVLMDIDGRLIEPSETSQ